jgi:dUTP pyrophosphatase
LAFNHSLTTLGGVLDPGYRGELKVMLFNLGNEPYEVQAGERIAQIIITQIDRVEIEEADELSETTRGANAFGSSGR